MFSVRSTNRLGLGLAMQAQDKGATSFRHDGARPSWKVIWQCQVPPKVRVLAWKICRNALSTQLNLAHRGMAMSSLCPICGQEDKDTFHVFLRCPHARNIWRAMAEVWDMPPDTMLTPTGPAAAHPGQPTCTDTHDNMTDMACPQ